MHRRDRYHAPFEPPRQRHAPHGGGKSAIMTLADFKASLAHEAPRGMPAALAALWWAGKGDWDKAHAVAQSAEGADAAWAHAYLHRVEGDVWNARYWYAKAGRAPATIPLDEEWEEMAAALLLHAKS